jgi:hypothetical protein
MRLHVTVGDVRRRARVHRPPGNAVRNSRARWISKPSIGLDGRQIRSRGQQLEVRPTVPVNAARHHLVPCTP